MRAPKIGSLILLCVRSKQVRRGAGKPHPLRSTNIAYANGCSMLMADANASASFQYQISVPAGCSMPTPVLASLQCQLLCIRSSTHRSIVPSSHKSIECLLLTTGDLAVSNCLARTGFSPSALASGFASMIALNLSCARVPTYSVFNTLRLCCRSISRASSI